MSHSRPEISGQRVGLTVEQEQPDDVTGQSQRPNNDDELGVRDLADVEEPLDGFHKDGKAQGEQEDTVDERSEDFRSLPSVRVLGRYVRVGQIVNTVEEASLVPPRRRRAYRKAWWRA